MRHNSCRFPRQRCEASRGPFDPGDVGDRRAGRLRGYTLPALHTPAVTGEGKRIMNLRFASLLSSLSGGLRVDAARLFSLEDI